MTRHDGPPAMCARSTVPRPVGVSASVRVGLQPGQLTTNRLHAQCRTSIVNGRDRLARGRGELRSDEPSRIPKLSLHSQLVRGRIAAPAYDPALAVRCVSVGRLDDANPHGPP